MWALAWMNDAVCSVAWQNYSTNPGRCLAQNQAALAVSECEDGVSETPSRVARKLSKTARLSQQKEARSPCVGRLVY